MGGNKKKIEEESYMDSHTTRAPQVGERKICGISLMIHEKLENTFILKY